MQGVPVLARRRALHVPRLPLPRSRRGRRRGRAQDRPRDRASASCARIPAQNVATSFSALPPEVRAYARFPDLLIVTKANARSTVHRPGYLDYVGIKRFDAAGNVCGEHRFLGLYTSTAYSASPADIPLLRRKTANVIERAGVARGSHAGKALRNILATYPRDELLPDERGRPPAHGDGHPAPGRAAALPAVRPARSVRALPRRASSTRRARTTRPSCARSGRRSCIAGVQRHELGVQRPPVGVGAGARDDHRAHARRARFRRSTCATLEARLALAARRWDDDLKDALIDALGEARGNELLRRFAGALPGGLSRGLRRARRGARHRDDGAALRRESARDEPLPSARGGAGHAALQALSPRRAGDAVRQPADAEADGTQGARRAAVPDLAAGSAAGLDARLRHADARRGCRRRHRRAARGVRGRVRRASSAARWRTTTSTGWWSRRAFPPRRSSCCAPMRSTCARSAFRCRRRSSRRRSPRMPTSRAIWSSSSRRGSTRTRAPRGEADAEAR